MMKIENMEQMDRADAGGEGLVLIVEEADSLWEARLCERWLGVWEGQEDDADDREALDRIAIVARIGGRWIDAIILADGEGRAQGLVRLWMAPGRREALARWASW
jgi:hypothetical protein